MTGGVFIYRYSLDKIKLSIEFPRFRKCNTVDDLLDVLNTSLSCYVDYKVKDCFVSKNKFKYYYGFSIVPYDSSEGSIFLSLFYNGGVSGNADKFKGLIEFNPNKNTLSFVTWLFDVYHFQVVNILSIDIAFDIPDVDINNVTVLTSNESLMAFGRSTNLSWYISPKTRDGRVKIYQKDIERALEGVSIAKTLRIEITIQYPYLVFGIITDKTIMDFKKYVKKLLCVSWGCSGDDYVLFLLSSVSNDIKQKALSMMSVNTRTKYKSMLKSNSIFIELDSFSFCSIVYELVADYIKGGKYNADCVSRLQ